jgi:NTP pyrophosphatase (non-canonical NTP hydrolase)
MVFESRSHGWTDESVTATNADRPRVVCLCGSTRFRQDFLAAQEAEALLGRIVVGPGVFSKAEGRALTEDEIERLRQLHRRKIEMADELLVVAPDGRIGEATSEEIEYGRSLGKTVRFWRPERPAPIDPVHALIESHRAQRLVSNDVPTLDVPDEVKALRCALIEEEAQEFREAIEADDIVGVADAIADLLYVVYGAARTFGLPVREIFSEVHRSNMTKLDDNGEPILRADGKVMKGPNFSAPDLAPLLEAAADQKGRG